MNVKPKGLISQTILNHVFKLRSWFSGTSSSIQLSCLLQWVSPGPNSVSFFFNFTCCCYLCCLSLMFSCLRKNPWPTFSAQSSEESPLTVACLKPLFESSSSKFHTPVLKSVLSSTLPSSNSLASCSFELSYRHFLRECRFFWSPWIKSRITLRNKWGLTSKYPNNDCKDVLNLNQSFRGPGSQGCQQSWLSAHFQ